MNITDKLSKEAKVLTDNVKDTLTANIVEAARRGDIKVDESQLKKMVALVDMSVGEAYQKALPAFQKSVAKHLK